MLKLFPGFFSEMLPLWILGGLTSVIALRGLVLWLGLRKSDQFLYELSARRFCYWFLLVFDYLTLLGFGIFAVTILWSGSHTADPLWLRSATVFVAWLGVGLLERFPLHRLRRQSDFDLQVNVVTNVILALLSALAFTAATALYGYFTG